MTLCLLFFTEVEKSEGGEIDLRGTRQKVLVSNEANGGHWGAYPQDAVSSVIPSRLAMIMTQVARHKLPLAQKCLVFVTSWLWVWAASWTNLPFHRRMIC